MTPEFEIRSILTSALTTYVPDLEIQRLIDSICLVVARALDTALFDVSEQPRIAEQVEYMASQWHQSMEKLDGHIQHWKQLAHKWETLARRLHGDGA
jgi:hypothetical protein